MTTLLNYLAVLAVAALLLGPSLYGALRDRRIDRELRAARRSGRTVPEKSRSEQPIRRTPRAAVRHAPGH